MTTEYTKFLNVLIKNNHDDEEYIIDIINNAQEQFKSFNEMLEREVRLKYFSKPFDIKEIIKTCFKNKGIHFDEYFLEKWINNEIERNSIQSREYAFKTIFALELGINDAKNLLKKMNISYNITCMEDFIYYACLMNRFNYFEAQNIIKEAKCIQPCNTKVVKERTLIKYAEKLEGKNSILKYIKNNYSSFNNEMKLLETNSKSIAEVLRSIIENINSKIYFEEKYYLRKCLKEKDIHFNRNTLENWFNGKSPKKSDDTRENMYKIAFALELDIEETKRLFIKVYKDRPFDIRRINEFVYYVCIKNKYDYQYAQAIIDEINEMDFFDTMIDSTRKLFDDLQLIQTKESILDYVQKHYSSFCTSNVSAKNVLDTLINHVIVKEEEKDKIKKKEINEKNSILAQELYYNPHLFKENHDITSISSMLTFIYGMESSGALSQNSFMSIGLPKEIITNMPTKQTFSKKDPSYEELRKMIILLASYKFWVISQLSEKKYNLEDYMFEINGYLLDANLSELYPGNQFDWLFLWCAFQDEPLHMFRNVFVSNL